MNIMCARCKVRYPKKELKSEPRFPGIRNRFFCDPCFLEEMDDQTAICPDCNILHLYPRLYPPLKWGKKLCPTCALKDTQHQGRILVAHLRLARRTGLPATLTLDEWYQTLYDFNVLCAYCQIRPYREVEHFIPVKLGGGTTKNNCVPSCESCNGVKRNIHPHNLLTHPLFQPGTLERVQSYLDTR